MDAADAGLALRAAAALALFPPGLAAGSFLTKIIHRAPYETALGAPSACPSCGGRIAWRDDIPLASWLMLGGKCRSCRESIPWRYPAVEVVTGVVWAVEGWRLAGLGWGWSTACLALLHLAFASSLIATAVIDWDCLIILDEISVGGAAVAVAAAPFLPRLHHAESVESFAAFSPELFLFFGGWPAWARSLGAALAGLGAGLAFSLLVYWFGNILFRKRIEEAQAEDPDMDSALGLGDVKLMGFFGAFLGWSAVFVIFLIGAVAGAAGGALLRLASGEAEGAPGLAGLRNRWRSGDSFLPFGPFLAFGAYCVMVAG